VEKAVVLAEIDLGGELPRQPNQALQLVFYEQKAKTS
jgi:hypothetical protein